MFGLLFQLLFWGGIIWLVIWLAGRDAKRTTVDYKSKTYAQGYWDGYRAHQQEAPGQHLVNAIPLTASESVPAAELPRPVTHAASADTKAKRDLQNINTTLYVASFLLVAAAALFIGTALPASVKFVGTWLITIAFYIGGLSLHARVPKLHPAAVAFVGTGLALLPFTGLAMYNFVIRDAALCWLVTSVIGVVAFVLTSVRLRSQVVAYFAIAFMVSLASSSVATVGAGLVWYFVVLLAVGSVATITAALRPTWLPSVFSQPVQQSGQWIVPLTLVTSLLTSPYLQVRDFEIITALSALYYAAVAVSDTATRARSVFIVRSLVSVCLLFIAYDITQSWAAVGVTLTVIGIAQVVTSLVALPVRSTGEQYNEAWLWLGFGLQLWALLFVLGNESWAELMSMQLVGLLLVSVGVAVVLRRAYLLLFAVSVGVLLPVVYGFSVIQPPLDAGWVAMGFLVLTAAALTLRLPTTTQRYPSLRPITFAAYVVYLTEALLFTAVLSVGWNVVIFGLAAALIYAIAVIEKQAVVAVVGNIALLITFGLILERLQVSNEWRSLVLAWLAFVTFYAAYWASVYLRKSRLGFFMLWSAVVVTGFLAVVNLVNPIIDVVIAAGLTLIIVALVLVLEGENRRQLSYYDGAAILITLGLQRVVAVTMPGIDGLVYSHWWAVVFIGLAYLYYRKKLLDSAKVRLIIGLSIVSFFSGVVALGTGESSYRLLFLVEHAVLLAAGLTLSHKLLSMWGAIGVVLAVLWLLAGYTFLLLLVIALTLIGGAVYALLRKTE